MNGLDSERRQLLRAGEELVTHWCRANRVRPPEVRVHVGRSGFRGFAQCAFYRFGVIHIWPAACARIGRAGRQWSYPGYAVDRTPYGVLAHELGHHVEGAHGPLGGNLAPELRQLTQEPPLTSYCPNDNEWFAEHFRLFVTNPGLSAGAARALYALMLTRWPRPVEKRPWREVLAAAPRQLRAAENRVARSRRSRANR